MTDELIEVAEDSARRGFFLISGTAVATLIMAIASILIGRFLGPELYGQYTLALVIPQLLFLFTDLGINQGIIRFVASLRAEGESDRATRIIQYGILFRVFLGTVVFAVNYALADVLAASMNRPNIGSYVQIASIAIVFQVIFTTANSAFVGLEKAEYDALSKNVQASVKTILSVGLVLSGFSVAGAVVGHVAGYIAASILGVGILLGLLKPSKSGGNNGFTRNLKTLTAYGMPLYISILLIGFLPLYQNLILAFFTTDVNVGNFKAATNFVALMSILSISITTALLPAFSKLDSSATEKIKAFFKLATKYASILIVPITTLIIIFSEEIVQIIYGSTYQSASFFLSINCSLYFLVAIGYLTLTSLFNGLGVTRITLKMTLINFVIFTVSAPVLAQFYSVPGVIIASLVSNTIGTSYAARIAKAKFKIEFDTRSVVKIFLASAIASVPALLLLQFASLPALFNVIVGGFLYLFIYVTLAPLAKIITELELRIARRVLQRIRLISFVAKPLLEYQQKILRTSTNN